MPSRAPAAGMSPGLEQHRAAVADERRQHPDERQPGRAVQAPPRARRPARRPPPRSRARRAGERDGACTRAAPAPRRAAPAAPNPSGSLPQDQRADQRQRDDRRISAQREVRHARRAAPSPALRICSRVRPKRRSRPAERLQRLVELGLAEVGPERVREVELGVGRLPEQEVRQPLLARGAHQQIELRQPAGLQRRREAVLGDLVGLERRRAPPARTARAPPRRSTRARRTTAPGTASSPGCRPSRASARPAAPCTKSGSRSTSPMAIRRMSLSMISSRSSMT